MIRDFINRWLGQEPDHSATDAILGSLHMLHHKVAMLNADLAAIDLHNRALARIIAKLDPLYGVPEDDPLRRKESDAISARAKAQLYTEAAVQRRPYDPEPLDCSTPKPKGAP